MLTQAVYLFFVAATIVRFYIGIITKNASKDVPLPTTCDTSYQHLTDLCLIVSTEFFEVNPNSRVILHIFAAIILLLSGGFALPVFQLFLT